MLCKSRHKIEAGDYGSNYVYFYDKDNQPKGEFTIEDRYIFDLRIYEEYRGQGYGNQMIKEITELYYNKPIFPLTLGVLKSNKVALHLYLKYGFKIYAENPEVYWMKYEGR